MNGNEKKTLPEEVLVNKFKEMNQALGVTNVNIGKLQQALGQEQVKAQQILGAMQNTGELLAVMIGNEEAQKIINEIQNPKGEEKKEKIDEKK